MSMSRRRQWHPTPVLLPGNSHEPEERPLWNSGDKVITCEMSALWLCSSGADLVLWDKSVLCEETERGALQEYWSGLPFLSPGIFLTQPATATALCSGSPDGGRGWQAPSPGPLSPPRKVPGEHPPPPCPIRGLPEAKAAA